MCYNKASIPQMECLEVIVLNGKTVSECNNEGLCVSLDLLTSHGVQYKAQNSTSSWWWWDIHVVVSQRHFPSVQHLDTEQAQILQGQLPTWYSTSNDIREVCKQLWSMDKVL